MKSRSLLLTLALCTLCGCVAKKPVSYNVIPTSNGCVHVAITDFTKVCKPVTATTALCDGVIVRYYCSVAPKDTK